MVMVKNKKQMFMIIGVFAIVLLLGEVTFAFSNYTRTGSTNTIRVGKIEFNAEQGTSFNLTNVFPIETTSSNLADNTKVGTVTIYVTGETDYSEGVEYVIKTTDDWANERKVLTTDEWNSLQQNGVSFKIKVEANVGTWVEGLPTINDMCPNCVFSYPTLMIYASWNDVNETPTDISSWSNNYRNVIATTSRNHFIGATKNENNQIDRLFTCNIVDDEPICLEINEEKRVHLILLITN